MPPPTEKFDKIQVLYEGPYCFVIDKPSGIATVSEGEDARTIVDLLGIDAELLVHRLDRGTSGCLLIAKDQQVRQFLQGQFKKRTVKKSYLAVVLGTPVPEEAVIDAPIGRSPTDTTMMSVYRSVKRRSARTQYRVLERAPIASLLLCMIETGRTHQVRVHLRSIGHPILGDSTYGNAASRKVSEKFRIERLCLHAWKLRFQAPQNGEVEVEAPVPVEIKNYLEKLNIQQSHWETSEG